MLMIELVDCNSISSDTDSACGVSIAPGEGVAMLVVGPDILHELAREIGGRGKDSSGNALALDFGEPQLHLIEPRGIGRCVVHLDPWMELKPRLDCFRLVRRVSVGSDTTARFWPVPRHSW